MCGRYTQHATWAEVRAFSMPLALATPEQDPEPQYNIAPSQLAWVIVAGEPGEGVAQRMRWGLIPSWAKDAKIAYSTINARVETAAEKPAFRAAWKHRRCLVVATGYYEWRAEGGVKQPYWVHPAQGSVMLFAGLWERNSHITPEPIDSYTIVTRKAEGIAREVHDRMPLSLEPAVLSDWLYGSADQASAIALAAPTVPAQLRKVGRAIGRPAIQGPACIAAV